MAFPAVESANPSADNATGGAATSGDTAATSHSVVLPATISAGSLLLVVGRVAVTGTVAVSGGGWTIIQDSSDASDDVSFWMYRDTLAAGSEDGSSITVTHGSGLMVARSYSITGAYDPAGQAPESSTVAVATSTTPNPTTVTPTGGAKDYLFIWFGSWSGVQTLDKTAVTLYTNSDVDCSTGTAGAATDNCQLKTGTRQLNAASTDPGTCTLSASPAGWTAWTLAVHPVPVGTTYTKTGGPRAGTRASGDSYEAVILRPDGDVSDGSWLTEVGGSALAGSIDEDAVSDADYIRSSLSPASADIAEVSLGDAADPLSSAGHIVRYRYGKDSAGGDAIDLTVRLVQGTTVIATWTHTGIADGWTLAEQTLSGAEANAITDYTDLRLRFESTEG